MSQRSGKGRRAPGRRTRGRRIEDKTRPEIGVLISAVRFTPEEIKKIEKELGQ